MVVYLAVVQGSLAAGQWLSFGTSKYMMYVSLIYLLMSADIAQASGAVERIRALRVPHSIHDSSDHLPTCDDEKGIVGPKVELRNVWFRYPTRDVPVLRGLNMTVEPGQFAAIVGPSGMKF